LNPIANPLKEKALMSSKKYVVRKPSKKIADSRKVRWGGGSAPQVLRDARPAHGPLRRRFGPGGTAQVRLRR
jgi:hypothetical protein